MLKLFKGWNYVRKYSKSNENYQSYKMVQDLKIDVLGSTIAN